MLEPLVVRHHEGAMNCAPKRISLTRNGNGTRVGAGVVPGGVGPLVGARRALLASTKSVVWMAPPTGTHKGPHPTSTPPLPLREFRSFLVFSSCSSIPG